jgi:hypothetical protein
MARTQGAKGIKPFKKWTSVPTSARSNIRHLSSIKGGPLDVYLGLLKHQENYLKWIHSRHTLILDLKSRLLMCQNPTSTKKGRVKEATYAKYRWYTEQTVVLESINSFETYFKTTLTRLGAILQPYVNPSPNRVLKINAKELWGITGEKLFPEMVPLIEFEQQLFHNLEEVDRATDLLIGKRRYNPNVVSNPLSESIKAIRGMFQIRHTLSHNAGLVTKSDRAKYLSIGLTITENEVIDPRSGSLSKAIFKSLASEAQEFNRWLRLETAGYLSRCIADRGLSVPVAKRTELIALLGKDKCWATVTWTP